MAMLFYSKFDDPGLWVPAIEAKIPGVKVKVWPDSGPADDIEFALVWKPPRDLLKGYPKLKAIFSLGAGVDHLFADCDLPAGVPVVRMIDPGLTVRMSEYVLMHALRLHRQVTEYEQLQRLKLWHELPATFIERKRVGIMGVGVLGGEAARKCAFMGFDVAGWSRTPKTLPGIKVFAGKDQLDAFLARTDILVCLLPLTPETDSIVNARTLAKLPRGAKLINAGRGRHVVEEDLLAAIKSGQVGGAVLDVFRKEPLPSDHPFWNEPRITITPHVASITMPDTAVESVAANVARLRRGEAMANAVDPKAGY